MAESIQLDKAAALVGKSEVTLRRLIKAGKIPFEKEKTLTGFIYRVDPDRVRGYYQIREGGLYEEGDSQAAPETEVSSSSANEQVQRMVRVAVAGESGAAHEYWQKKSDLYEERYNTEVLKHAQTREDLGVWRGRAEQSQAMLMKLLPASMDVEIKQNSLPEKEVSAVNNSWTVALVTGLIVLLLVAVAAIAYLKFLPH